MTVLPLHPFTGLQALGFTSRGPIWPVMGGSQPFADPAAPPAPTPAPQPAPQPDPQPNPDPQPDPAASDRGFPENTPIKDMTAEEQANYWKFHDRRKSNILSAYDGITPEQAKQFKEQAEQQRLAGLQPGERALEDARNEAAAAAAKAAAEQWAPEFARQVIGQFVTEKAQQDSILAGLDPMKFVKDGRFDTDALVGHMTGLAAAFGGAGAGEPPRQWGQSGDLPPAPSASEQGLAEARRRGFIK